MSKINQIQNALRELSGGGFQKLADAYLHKKGYEQINPLGSVIGADKVRKGTPDTLVSLPNGKYIFAEHTTESDKRKGEVFQKFNSDLDKCFDEAKTKISVDKIQEVVLCHTSMLNPEEEKALRERCQKLGINLNIFGIGPISYDLYQKYPGIARDFLGVEVDTGQIVDIAEFVNAYDKKAGTSLNTSFYFREKELEQALQGLETNNLIIVSGKAGVGKSRFVLECCSQFLLTHPEYEVRCIFFRGQNLFEDLRVYFSEPGSYLIFVDDANRVNSFDYFIQLLHDQREDQQIKVVATVRDYALNKVQELAKSYKNLIELEISSLDEEQIKQILREEYKILNTLYLDRITDIAQGNPRLAVMTALLAKQENKLNSINDVSSLYDEYYCSIQKDLKELGNESLLKVAGIVSFFRTVDRSNEAMMEVIEQAFEINQQDFWKAAHQLHNHELLDMYENEIVRVSDQVLATYLFYLAFFKERLLNFGVLLEHFFPQYQHRLVDALNPVLNTFNSERCIQVMRPHVDRIWREYRDAGDEKTLMHLIQVFWFLKKTDTLLYVHDCISNIEPELVDLSNQEIKSNSNIPSPSLLNILGLFARTDENDLRTALALALNYTKKRPIEISQTLCLLTERYGFDHDSYRYGFAIQRIVIDVLWKQVKNADTVDVMFARLFIAVAQHYLYTEFNTTRMKGTATINIFQFTLPSTPELIEFRREIWERTFQLYEIAVLKDDVLNLLHDYSTSGHKVSVDELIIQDSGEVIPFILSKLDTNCYSNCLIVQSYLNHLQRHNIPFDEDLRYRFINETYALSEVLITDRSERKYLNLDYEEYEQLRYQRIQDFFANYTLENYKQFFEQCLEIQQETDRRNHNLFYLPGQVARVLTFLAERDPQLYTDVFKHYLSLGDPLKIRDLTLVNKLLNILGVDNTYQLLSQPNYISRKWLFDFYCLLPQESIKAEHPAQLCSLFQESDLSEIPRDLNFILKYHVFGENVLVRIVEIILGYTPSKANKFYSLLSLFDDSTESDLNLLELFKSHLDVLKQAYLGVLEINRHIDDEGRSFTCILKHDANFILEYIDWIYQKKEQLYRFDNIQNHSFLWRFSGYNELMTQVIEYIYKRNQEDSKSGIIELSSFFTLNADEEDNEVLWQRQDQLLAKLIESQHSNIEFTKFLFDVTTEFSRERRYSLIDLFLRHNKDFEDFKQLPLEPSSWSTSGSWIPVYQNRIEYLESLLPLLNTVDFLQHKQYLEQHIQWLHEYIEREKKNDFMND